MYLEGTAGANVLNGGAEDDVIFGLGGNDTLRGAGGYDALLGGDGNDSLSGGALDDFLIGGAGNDTLDGGTGDDWSSYEDVGAAVSVSLNITAAQNTLGGGTDKLIGIENLYGSAFNDTLIGNSAVNYLSGGAGNDSLFGGAGDDHLEGGAGDDFIDGGDGIDVISFDNGAVGGVRVYISTVNEYGTWPSSAVGHGSDTFINIEDVWATQYDDVIVGNNRDNNLFGLGGNDTLGAGYGGTDYLDGGSGDDLLVVDWYGPISWNGDVYLEGGDGFDRVTFYDYDSFAVTIDLAKTGPQYLDADTIVTLSSIEGVVGPAGGGTFYASNVQNSFELHGLGAPDTVVFRSLAELGNGAQADKILGSARIDVSAIDADTTQAGNQAFHFVTRPGGSPSFPDTTPTTTIYDTAFTGHAGEIIVTAVPGGHWLAQFDVNGDKVADAALYFQNMYVGGFVF